MLRLPQPSQARRCSKGSGNLLSLPLRVLQSTAAAGGRRRRWEVQACEREGSRGGSNVAHVERMRAAATWCGLACLLKCLAQHLSDAFARCSW